MAAPSAVQLAAWTDRIAAQMKLNLAGYDTELASASLTSLGAQVDGSGDLSLEAAMIAASNAIDDQSLPENYYAALTSIRGRAGYVNWMNALRTYLGTTAGGSYASLRAACTAISATLHPLVAELERAISGENAFTLSDDVTTVFAPNYAVRSADRVYTGVDGSLVDDTTDASDVGTADVALFAADDDYCYIGSRYKFSQVIVGCSTRASATIDPTWAYWNGNAWATLTVTDNSVGLTKNQNIKWTVPSDWVRSYKDTAGNTLADATPLYYLRIKRTANSITAPTASGIRLVPAVVPTASGGSLHLGVDQPPLAICRITAASTIVVESIVAVDYTRFKEPAIRLRALSIFGAAATPTVAYVDQAGNTGNTQAQSAWSSPAAYDVVAVTLAGADTGVRSIETSGWAVTTAETDSIFAVEVVELRVPAL